MLGVVVRRTVTALQSVIHADRGPTERTGIRRAIMLSALEDRKLLSATPLGTLAVESTPPLDADLLFHNLQLLTENYSDNVADRHDPRSGTWAVVDGRYQATPVAPNGDSVSTLLLDPPLPVNMELSVTFNADDVASSYFSNAFVIFDYQGPTDFKFAGAYVGGDRWVMGHRSASDWVIDAQVNAPIAALTDYNLRLTIIDDQVTLYADGNARLTLSYSTSVTDGQLGLGTQNAVSRFDDLGVQSLLPDTVSLVGDLPLSENFDDLAAEHLDPRSGTWLLTNGTYWVSPEISGDGISTANFRNDFTGDVEIGVTINADERIDPRFSNAFIIFDYQSPTDFKYAGAFVHRDEWAIGHRTPQGWSDDVLVRAPLDAGTDYGIRLVLENGSQVSLYHEDALVASHTFGDDVTDGAVGLGTYNSVARFDNFTVVDESAPPSDISAEWDGDDLTIHGESGGEVQIVAIQNDAFQIFDAGRLLFTVEGVTGDLSIDLGDAADRVTLDLGGYTFRRNISVSLGSGDNTLEVTNGSIGGHLVVAGGDGRDEIVISDSATVLKHARVTTGAADDSFVFSGLVARGLFLDSGQGADSLVLSGVVKVGFFANTGKGDDRVEILASADLGHNAVVKLGDGDDFLHSAKPQRHLVVLPGDGTDTVQLAESSLDHQRHSNKRDHKKKGAEHSQVKTVADPHPHRKSKSVTDGHRSSKFIPPAAAPSFTDWPVERRGHKGR